MAIKVLIRFTARQRDDPSKFIHFFVPLCCNGRRVESSRVWSILQRCLAPRWIERLREKARAVDEGEDYPVRPLNIGLLRLSIQLSAYLIVGNERSSATLANWLRPKFEHFGTSVRGGVLEDEENDKIGEICHKFRESGF
ncbi:uncharacterized protein [Prorops nasuta]|uniref:uncharacterized protein n=1 Tax=Prorops nasuta TaxID=863751 RepID=UPI0034CE1BE8